MPYTLWLTDSGVAVHGSSVRYGRATNGCVGVPIEFARRLFDAVNVGDEVEIIASRDLQLDS
jgi:lipoprotein-anchoring transpeptidase ErfK/SrfK